MFSITGALLNDIALQANGYLDKIKIDDDNRKTIVEHLQTILRAYQRENQPLEEETFADDSIKGLVEYLNEPEIVVNLEYLRSNPKFCEGTLSSQADANQAFLSIVLSRIQQKIAAIQHDNISQQGLSASSSARALPQRKPPSVHDRDHPIQEKTWFQAQFELLSSQALTLTEEQWLKISNMSDFVHDLLENQIISATIIFELSDEQLSLLDLAIAYDSLCDESLQPDDLLKIHPTEDELEFLRVASKIDRNFNVQSALSFYQKLNEQAQQCSKFEWVATAITTKLYSKTALQRLTVNPEILPHLDNNNFNRLVSILHYTVEDIIDLFTRMKQKELMKYDFIIALVLNGQLAYPQLFDLNLDDATLLKFSDPNWVAAIKANRDVPFDTWKSVTLEHHHLKVCIEASELIGASFLTPLTLSQQNESACHNIIKAQDLIRMGKVSIQTLAQTKKQDINRMLRDGSKIAEYLCTHVLSFERALSLTSDEIDKVSMPCLSELVLSRVLTFEEALTQEFSAQETNLLNSDLSELVARRIIDMNELFSIPEDQIKTIFFFKRLLDSQTITLAKALELKLSPEQSAPFKRKNISELVISGEIDISDVVRCSDMLNEMGGELEEFEVIALLTAPPPILQSGPALPLRRSARLNPDQAHEAPTQYSRDNPRRSPRGHASN